MMNNKQYKLYINGLKGFACILIMFGHFLGIYKYAQEFEPRIFRLDQFLALSYAFLVDEGYWLYLFFVVSGYLVTRSKVSSVFDVIKKAFIRFVRFVFPIFFAYLVIYWMYLLFGFHNMETKDLFICNWYQKYYATSYSMLDVVWSPIKVLFSEKCVLNPTFWVLRYMFIASLIIYAIKYLFVVLNDKHPGICLSLIIILTCISFRLSPIVTACLMGMIISLYEETDIANKTIFSVWVMIIVMMVYVFPKKLIPVFFFGTLIILIPRVKVLNNILSTKLFQVLGKISWGVYSFHWPLFCSCGALIIIRLTPEMGLLKAYVIASGAITIATLVLSVLFYETFERLSTWITKKVNSLIFRNNKNAAQ